jgi:hypothetical protein
MPKNKKDEFVNKLITMVVKLACELVNSYEFTFLGVKNLLTRM